MKMEEGEEDGWISYWRIKRKSKVRTRSSRNRVKWRGFRH